MQQVATVNVDNEFTDFNEPVAETVHRLEGLHARAPVHQRARSSSRRSTRTIDYNTNWQAWGNTSASIDNTRLPGDGARHRRGPQLPHAPTRRSRTRRPTSTSSRASTSSTSARASTSSARSSGINETDKRLNDAAVPPLRGRRLPGQRRWTAQNVKNFYRAGNSTATLYFGNPPVITVPTASAGLPVEAVRQLSDDDRDLKYHMLPARRRLPAHQRPLRLARRTSTTTPT